MKLYENSPPNFEEMKTYYPVWYWDVNEMVAIWRVMGGKLDAIRAGLLQAVDNNFISTADESAIKDFEAFYRIAPSAYQALDERRSVLMASLMGQGSLSGDKIKEVVRLIANAESELELKSGSLYVLVTFENNPENPTDYIGTLRSTLERQIPAHLQLITQYALIPTGQALSYIGVAAAGMHMSITAEVKNYGVG